MKRIPNLLVYIVGGLLGAVLSIVIRNNLLRHIGEYNDTTSNVVPLLVLGIVTALCLFLGGMPKGRSMYSAAIPYILVVFIIIGILLGRMDSDILGWLILVPIMTSLIHIGKCVVGSLVRTEPARRLMSVLGAGIGGAVAGGFIVLISLISTSFAMDTGYALFTTLILALESAILGIVIIGAVNLAEILFTKTFSFAYNQTFIPQWRFVASIIFALILLTATSIGVYYRDSNYLTAEAVIKSDEFILSHTILPVDGVQDIADNIHFTRESLVGLLEDQPSKDISVIATLYLLSGDERWGQQFRSTLLDEAQRGQLTGAAGSVKAKQFQVSIRAYYFLEITERQPHFFTEGEKQIIVDWFRDINERIFSVEWSDFYYGLAFQKIPDGPYENQEIGVGALSVLSGLLTEDYPELARKDNLYVDKFAQGWQRNFRNPDDGIVYHQTLWIKNAYLLARYGGQAEYVRSSNSRNSFEWILTQWPSNGISPAYNSSVIHTAYDVMTLGAYLFNDGRYKWLAERMLAEEVKTGRDLCGILGLSYWCDNLKPQAPLIGSCSLQGTTGLAQKPGPLRPDKVVLRDGWDQESLYALLNLRFAGWHSYKATNSIITIMSGVPFVVEDIPVKAHSWLPQGTAKYRDKKIDRIRLNGFQIEARGLPKILYQLTGFGSPWSQDPPYFADILFFDSTEHADFSKTRILNWHGWTHNRVCILVKGDYIVVFDNAQGGRKQEVAITWHLKGDADFGRDHLTLTQGNNSLAVHYPHSNDWYQVQVSDSYEPYSPAGEVHAPDVDLYFTSRNQLEAGFITLFYPTGGEQQYKVKRLDVRDRSGEPAHPRALGIKISNPAQIDIVGANFGLGEIRYDLVTTDAQVFIFQIMVDGYILSFENATTFAVETVKKPSKVEYNGRILSEESEWNYSVNEEVLSLEITDGCGEIKILF